MYRNFYPHQYSYGTYQNPLASTRADILLDESDTVDSEPEDLGDGFYLYHWNVAFPANAHETYFLRANNQKVISGGWAPGGYWSSTIFENYPKDKYHWVISIRNSGGRDRDLNLYLITKE
ncbi:hypothetical protein L8C07_12430 [Paenibacillus sp. CMAA1739]|uniref:hypothetical protein n=1 Tax=Paenibacillus ottowii TaxID=2315729 RepID=UPI002DBBDC73|nr:hypothetical protein [Paenibacillus sp. CMAA1739]MEC4566754.1 hypothetical protein [Paenibacillus sp. CMAA1739]